MGDQSICSSCCVPYDGKCGFQELLKWFCYRFLILPTILVFKVLALVFIRKLLDFFFTKRELSWLDDLMPESKKKKEDDKKKKEKEVCI